MRRLGALPLMYQPGERWLYNMSCDLLGVLVARASGRSFSAFLDERLFGPLGMKDTRQLDLHAEAGRRRLFLSGSPARDRARLYSTRR